MLWTPDDLAERYRQQYNEEILKARSDGNEQCRVLYGEIDVLKRRIHKLEACLNRRRKQAHNRRAFVMAASDEVQQYITELLGLQKTIQALRMFHHEVSPYPRQWTEISSRAEHLPARQDSAG